MSTSRPLKIGFALQSSAYSPRCFLNHVISSRSFSIALSGRSCDTPPTRMYAWFIRSPVMSSKTSSTFSRSRKPIVITVRAPISMPPVAIATRWDEIRFSSIMSTRMVLARSVMSSSMPSSFSTAPTYAASLKNGER